MTDELKYTTQTMGVGSAFTGLIYSYLTEHRGTWRFIEQRDGFRSRGEAHKWGRARIRELRGLPPIKSKG